MLENKSLEDILTEIARLEELLQKMWNEKIETRTFAKNMTKAAIRKQMKEDEKKGTLTKSKIEGYESMLKECEYTLDEDSYSTKTYEIQDKIWSLEEDAGKLGWKKESDW